MKLNGQTIVLTGASSGIGAEAAVLMAKRGARLCLVARREEQLREVQQRVEAEGASAAIYPCDLSDNNAIEACASQILAEHPQIDALVNNAAHSIRRPIEQSLDRLHDYQRTMQLNYMGAVAMTLKLLPRFLEQGHGHVVNISSLSTQIPIPLFSAYLASKSALESFTRSLQAEMGHQGITTTVVYFPMVRTPMSSKTKIYKYMPMMHVQKAAGWIVEACEKRPARISRPLGNLGSMLLAAAPGPITKLPQPLFRGMDQLLASRLKKKG
ncbi:MAG: SDR family NAD(P)-dependent oxidoreductase [Alcanivorax sediminis]|uniref:SDR family NAD(P)-dependent oxidoreductase n=1 Tax=Alcanivorax sediminis TaxID=2663008 RepID=A0A6N7LQM7_9GAMM|nr:SDR family NAD(P)-dependent oxidoreductase [Alcanivorax sediminis]MQX52607.1 SDR family NAD(P)-dependent oxidoreductase [Alcanivorax sediminis]